MENGGGGFRFDHLRERETESETSSLGIWNQNLEFRRKKWGVLKLAENEGDIGSERRFSLSFPFFFTLDLLKLRHFATKIMPLINLAIQFEMCSLFAAFSSCAAAKTSQKAYFPVVFAPSH